MGDPVLLLTFFNITTSTEGQVTNIRSAYQLRVKTELLMPS